METWSERKFESMLPDEWLTHGQSKDYGIDLRVEIFDGTAATGLEFNVQMKSTSKGSGQNPGRPVKRSTMNYWASLASPTLVVVAHRPSETLWCTWAHLLPWEADPGTKSRLVRGEHQIDESIVSSFVEEVRAYRGARSLTQHLPLHVVLQGTSFYGGSTAPVKAKVRDLLKGRPSNIRVVNIEPEVPYVAVAFSDEFVQVQLLGTPARQLTWSHPGLLTPSSIAADIVSAIAFAAAHGGARDVCADLLKSCVAESNILPEAIFLPAAVGTLLQFGDEASVMTLVRRTVTVEGHPNGMHVLAAIALHAETLGHLDLRDRVAYELSEATQTWMEPSHGLYNAGNFLRDSNPAQAIELYERAADADPSYRDRSYWWREKGNAHWNAGESEAAKEHYAEAERRGDASATALRADVLMRTGSYAEARDILSHAPIAESKTNAQWRLTGYALECVVEFLHIPLQRRDAFPGAVDNGSRDVQVQQDALSRLAVDALDYSAHVDLLSERSDRTDEDAQRENVLLAIAAAVSALTEPELWYGLILTALSTQALGDEESDGIVFDAFTCAWIYLGDAFQEYLTERMTDEEVDEAFQQRVLRVFEWAMPDAEKVELRHHTAEGWESYFI